MPRAGAGLNVRLRPYLALGRSSQWVKNGFVLVGLLFSRRWQETAILIDAATVFVGFCLLSSAIYAINDVFDRERDRTHPIKRSRPVASGQISPAGAIVFGVGLLAIAIGLAAVVSMVAVAIFVIYVLFNLAYSSGAKHVPILDVFIIAGGFMLRLLAGTAGIEIEPSQWLIVCGFMVTLYLGFAKRRAELMTVPDTSDIHRPVLQGYTRELLDTMISVTAAGVLVTYSLYTVSEETILIHGTRELIWTLPFVAFGLFRFLHLVHFRGAGADPARDLLHDPQLVIAGCAWLLAVVSILGLDR